MAGKIRIIMLHHRAVPMTRENEDAYAMRDKPRFRGNLTCPCSCSLCDGNHCWILASSEADETLATDVTLDDMLHNEGGVVWGCRHCAAWMETTPDCCTDDERHDLLWDELHTAQEAAGEPTRR